MRTPTHVRETAQEILDELMNRCRLPEGLRAEYRRRVGRALLLEAAEVLELLGGAAADRRV